MDDLGAKPSPSVQHSSLSGYVFLFILFLIGGGSLLGGMAFGLTYGGQNVVVVSVICVTPCQ